MSDWKQEIERQIAVTDLRGDYMNQHASVDSNMHYESAETMRLLLAVAVAAEYVQDCINRGCHSMETVSDLRYALDKLREKGDE